MLCKVGKQSRKYALGSGYSFPSDKKIVGSEKNRAAYNIDVFYSLPWLYSHYIQVK